MSADSHSRVDWSWPWRSSRAVSLPKRQKRVGFIHWHKISPSETLFLIVDTVGRVLLNYYVIAQLSSLLTQQRRTFMTILDLTNYLLPVANVDVTTTRKIDEREDNTTCLFSRDHCLRMPTRHDGAAARWRYCHIVCLSFQAEQLPIVVKRKNKHTYTQCSGK